MAAVRVQGRSSHAGALNAGVSSQYMRRFTPLEEKCSRTID